MTSGQRLALWQLREIEAAADHALVIEMLEEPTKDFAYLRVTISIRVGPTATAEGGLQLREREDFLLLIPPSFPFHKPEVWVQHNRFAGKPHVQWVHSLCLYQSATEWNVGDGMFGLIDRLEYWLRQGALNQLDPDDQPLHPPAVYTDVTTGKLVIPKADTPIFSGLFWLGLARVAKFQHRIEITSWCDIDNLPTDGDCALALLFSAPLPWEYPTKGSALFQECERQGVSKEFLFRLLKASTLLTPQGEQLFVVLGSPMRRISGGVRKQHLSVWALDSKTADYIRNTIKESGDTRQISELRAKMEELLVKCLEDVKISWCPVVEARPEVTIRRDHASLLSSLQGKSVSIWGCGALGGYIAEYLYRAGVRKLVIWDRGIVSPGLLVRQLYKGDDVGRAKVEALRNRLLEIRNEGDCEIIAHSSDLEKTLSTGDFEWTDGCDLVIDATASDLVRRRLEMVWNRTRSRRVSIAAVMIDQTANQMIAVVVGSKFSGATWDVIRKTKTQILRDPNLLPYADSFFPSEIKQKPFQPEPGCSEPTFVGSAADSAGLAAIALNFIADRFVHNSPDIAYAQLFCQPSPKEHKSVFHPSNFEFRTDIILRPGDYEVRFEPAALYEIKAWIAQNKRLRNPKVETGGLLWGEWDDATGIICVNDASGPPPDSKHSEDFFICGTKGTKDEHEARTKLTRLSVGYIGMWHTHPNSQTLPSGKDLEGMHEILTNGPIPPRKNVLLIIGRHTDEDTLGVYTFRRLSGDSAVAEYEITEDQIALKEATL